MTFEDGVAYSRNVVAAKVALGLGKTTKASSAMLYDTWTKLGFGAPTGIDLAGEVAGIVRDPAITPWAQIDLANGAFGQGVAVTPDPARAGVRRAAQRRGPRPAARRQVGRRPRHRAHREGPRHDRRAQQDPDRADAPRHRGGDVLPRPDARPGLRGRRQDRHRPDLGLEAKGRWKHNLFNYSFVGYVAREAGRPDLVVAVRIEEGTPTTVRLGQLEMPVMSFELFRRIAHDAINTPDLVPERPRGPVVVADAAP